MTGTNTYSAADMAAVIPELWLPVVLEAYFAKTVAANFFLDLSSMAPEGAGGDTFHVADIFTNVFTSSTKSNGSEVTLVSPAMTDISISVSTWNEVSYLIEDLELRQTPDAYNILARLAEQAGAVLADDLEDSLLGLWSGVSGSVGTTSAAVTDIQVRQCVRTLDSSDVPRTDRAWFFHPRVFWDQVHGLQKYYDASQAGWTGQSGPTITGNFGSFDRARGLYGALYGDPVFISTNVVSNNSAYRNIYAHRDAFGFIVQTPGGSRVRMQSEYILENLGILTVTDTVYGVSELRDANAVVLNASTSASQ